MIVGWFKIPVDLKARGYTDEYRFGIDFYIYYNASRGDLAWNPKVWYFDKYSGWLYPHWTAIFWYWCRWLDFKTAWLIWYIFLCLSYLFLTSKLLRLDYGWLLALAGIKPILLCLQTGNIVPLVALCLLSPSFILLAACFKLWPLFGLPIHFLVEGKSGGNGISTTFHNQKTGCAISRKLIRDSLSGVKPKAETSIRSSFHLLDYWFDVD
jgi:hypothetical protein